MTSLLSLKLLVRCFEGLGLAAGPGQVEPPCALGCGWTLGCSRQALSTQPPVSLGGSASAGWAAQGVRLACGAWAYTSRALVGAFNFCEKPIFTEKKKKKRQTFVVCCRFSFLCVCFYANHLAVDTAGGIQRVEAVHLEIQQCGP